MEVNISNIQQIVANFSVFDIVISFFIMIFAVRGLIGGFINELSKLFGWIVGISIAARFGTPTGEFLNSLEGVDLGGKAAVTVVGFVIILSAFLLSVYLINSILTAITKKLSGLNFINKFFGFIFGGAKVFLILSIIIGALHGIPLIKSYLFDRFKMEEEKVFFPIMIKTGKYILNLEYVQKTKDDGLKKLEKLELKEKSEENEKI